MKQIIIILLFLIPTYTFIQGISGHFDIHEDNH